LAPFAAPNRPNATACGFFFRVAFFAMRAGYHATDAG
jgi:hypothetical protein